MYTDYFGLKEKPFSITPDPRYLYMSEQHQDALAHLLYGIQEGEGFVLLTGDIGTGKTTICRSLLEQIPDLVEVAYIFNPKLSAKELLLSICDEFLIPLSNTGNNISIKQVIDKLNGHLLEQYKRGRRSVLIIDEAQNLSINVLEQIRLLTNLETNSRKLLQIILIGQPELRKEFQRPELEQLAQRITARFHIGPLSSAELENYLKHRIYVAGGSNRPLFSRGAIKALFKFTRGIPRLINTVSDRALLATYVNTQHQVTKKEIQVAAAEVLNASPAPSNTILSGFNNPWMFVSSLTVSITIAFCVYILGPKFQLPILSKTSDLQQVTGNSSYVTPLTGKLHRPLSSYETRFSQVGTIPEAKSARQQQESNSLASIHHTTAQQFKLIAQQALLARWNIETPLKQSDDFCKIAEVNALKCLQGQYTFDTFIKLNRPAVVQLINDSGQPYFATINRIMDQQVELLVGGNAQLISLNELSTSWTGEFELLWRPPFQYSQAISAKSSAQSIQWFREKLNIASSKAETNLPIYIAPIEKQILLFQKETGLHPDGFAGPETIIAINNLSDVSVPLLTILSEAD